MERHKFTIAKEPSPEELEQQMNEVADQLTTLTRLNIARKKEFTTSPTPELEREINMTEFEIAELQKKLQAHSKIESDRLNSKHHGPWSDPYVGGRNGIGRK